MPKPVPVKVAPKPKSAKDPAKEAKRLENIRLGTEAAVRKREHLARCRPLVEAYFSGHSIFTSMVVVDGVECLRPLAIGTRQRVITELAELPQCEGVSTSTLNELVTAVLHAHTMQEAYQRGLLLLGERFDLAGNVAGAVAPKHKDKAQSRIDRAGVTQ